jgi:hypothetical protein
VAVIPMLVGGLVLIVVDFRTAAPDLLPDIVGWALIVVAARRLTLTAAAWLAALAGVASLADAWLPYRHVLIDPRTGEPLPAVPGANLGPAQLVYDDVTGWRLAAVAAGAALAGSALVTLLFGIARLVESSGRVGPARQFRIVAWLIIPIWTLPFLAAVANAVVNESGEFDPVWNGGLVYVWLAGFALIMYLVVLLVREHDRSWIRQAQTPRSNPRTAVRNGPQRS